MLFNCLHPRKIVQNGESRTVPCGTCAACLNRKSYKLTKLVKGESLLHKFSMFVTLTYSDEHIPLMKISSVYGGNILLPVTSRLQKHILRFGRSHIDYIREGCSPSYMSMLYNKFSLKNKYGLIPVLDSADVQDFLKRLRYFLNKFTHEKVRYIAVGEYGPVHFRPHYHFIFWFDEETTLHSFSKCISKAWTFGRTDTQLSKGPCSSYVASYISSFVNIPRVYQGRASRPFVLHSSHLSESLFQAKIYKIYEYEFRDFVDTTISFDGNFTSFPPPMSFENYFFPKCLGFSSLDTLQRKLCYMLYDIFRKKYKEESVTKLSKLIFENYEDVCFIKSFSSDSKRFSINSITSALFNSKKFISLCHDYFISPDYLLKRIEKYYSDKDYYNLCNQLRSQQEFTSTSSSEDLCFLLFYYDNFELPRATDGNPSFNKAITDYILSLNLEPCFVNDFFIKLENFPVYVEFFNTHNKLIKDRVKHKHLNDLNKIFL